MKQLRGLLDPILPIYHWLRAAIAVVINGFPARGMKVIAVTGTNGKTTTAAYISKIVEATGREVAVSTTAFFKVGEDYRINDQNMTVTNPFELQAFLKNVRKQKIEWVILEVTSHGLSQFRTLGVKPLVAVMTNLTQDHLDYHGTMHRYAEAKAKLFKKRPRFIVLNRDDEWFEFFNRYRAKRQKLNYGTSAEADVRIEKAKLSLKGSGLEVAHRQGKLKLVTLLAGKFNAYNALCAATVALALGISREAIEEGISSLEVVPGRMETIPTRRHINVIVDYAHTPEALLNALDTLRKTTKKKLITVFGATGDRDTSKRPKMGRIVGRLSDVAIVTDDEPYSEEPSQIREALIKGLKSAEKNVEIKEVGDRKRAIKKAIDMAQVGDTVFITGMGHQKFRVVGSLKEPWDDREITKEILAKKTKR